jgi:hypothetical protein
MKNPIESPQTMKRTNTTTSRSSSPSNTKKQHVSKLITIRAENLFAQINLDKNDILRLHSIEEVLSSLNEEEADIMEKFFSA